VRNKVVSTKGSAESDLSRHHVSAPLGDPSWFEKANIRLCAARPCRHAPRCDYSSRCVARAARDYPPCAAPVSPRLPDQPFSLSASHRESPPLVLKPRIFAACG